MRSVSTKFLDTVTGSHRMVSRARVVDVLPGLHRQFGLQPTGTEIEILSGDVKLSSSADIKSTLDIETSGEHWDLLEPYGNEIFVERGIDYGDGTREWVGLGYFRIEEIHQENAPNGPIRITAKDRTAQLMQSRPLWPFSIGGLYHRYTYGEALELLVNGRSYDNTTVNVLSPMFVNDIVPINWWFTSDTATVSPDLTFEDSVYDFIESQLSEVNSTMRFNASGELDIIRTYVDNIPVYTIKAGVNGTLVKASRGVSRAGVYNVVSAFGSDPVFPNVYATRKITSGPLAWNGLFGQAPRHYSSPVLQSDSAAGNAAGRILSQYTGLPYSLSLFTVPNPALEPFDVIEVVIDGQTTTHVIEEVTIPLTADDGVSIETRTLTDMELL